MSEKPPVHIGTVLAGMGAPRPRGSADMDAGGMQTKHGWLSWQDIHDAGGKLTNDANGNRVIQFPTWTKEQGLHYRAIPDHKLTEGGR